MPYPQYGTDILKNLLELSASGDKKVFEFVLGNLYGVSLRRMKTIAANRRSAPFIGLSRDEIIDLILSRISWICTGRMIQNWGFPPQKVSMQLLS